MTKESVRKCSHCGHNGHNSRTCNNSGKGGSFKLFGVTIDPVNNVGVGKDDDHQSNGASSIRRSKSMGNLPTAAAAAAACNNINEGNNNVVAEQGYLSDGHLQIKERRKGSPWTEDEHRQFLVGLTKLGKGDWKGISRNYVPSRTPTQVASHAQKYYIRLAATEKKKRRLSVFDMPMKEGTPSPPQASPSEKAPEVSLQLSSAAPPTPMKTTTSNIVGQASTSKLPLAALSERPPLSPVPRAYGIPDFNTAPHMVGYPSMGQRIYAENKYTQTVFVPVLNYANNSSHDYPVDNHVAFATCSFMTRPLLVQPMPNGTSQAAKKDGLAVGIGALSI